MLRPQTPQKTAHGGLGSQSKVKSHPVVIRRQRRQRSAPRKRAKCAASRWRRYGKNFMEALC
jgi:hypothetical protein